MCLGAKAVTSANAVEVNEAEDLFRKKLTQTTATSSTPSVGPGSDAEDHDSSALSDTSSVVNLGDEMTQEDSLVVKALPTSELERVHGKCTQKWRQLSAQRKAVACQRNPKGESTERPLPTPRPSHQEAASAQTAQTERAAPRGGSATKNSRKHLGRHGSRQSRLDSIRKRHAQCITALKSTVEAKKEASRRASEDGSSATTSMSTLAEILNKTVQIQETQEYLRQNLDLKAHYEALKALNEALLSELESCRRENTELYEQIAILEGNDTEAVSPQSDKQQESDKEQESDKQQEALKEESEDIASSSGSETLLAPCSGLNLMSPYGGWARLISN